MPTKAILLGLALESRNLGIGALGAGILTCALEIYPDADITFLDYGKDSLSKIYTINGLKKTVQFLNMRFSKKLYLGNNVAVLIAIVMLTRLLPSKTWRESIFKKNKYLRRVHEADIVGAISGGDSFSDLYGIGRFYYVALPQVLVLLMQKHLVLLPQTLGPFEGRLTQRIAYWILNQASLIFSRDTEGVAEIKSILRTDKTKVRFCYDVGFAVEPVRSRNIRIIGMSDWESRSKLVGLNISGLLYMGGYTRDNMFGLNIHYPEFVNKLISVLIDILGCSVLLIPHVFGTEAVLESDEVVCRKVYDALRDTYPGKMGCLDGQYDPSEVKYVIGQCDFFVGSRMHACIAAVSQNIPAVSIAYSGKFKGVMDTVGMGNYVADPRSMTEMEILELIENAYAERNSTREKLAAAMPEVKSNILRLFKEIRDELKHPQNLNEKIAAR